MDQALKEFGKLEDPILASKMKRGCLALHREGSKGFWTLLYLSVYTGTHTYFS